MFCLKCQNTAVLINVADFSFLHNEPFHETDTLPMGFKFLNSSKMNKYL